MIRRATGLASALTAAFVGMASANKLPLKETQSPLTLPQDAQILPPISAEGVLTSAPKPVIANSPEALIPVAAQPKQMALEELLKIAPVIVNIVEGTPLTFFTVNDPHETDFIKRNKLVILDDRTGTICINEETGKETARTKCYDAASMPTPDVSKVAVGNVRSVSASIAIDNYGDGANKAEIVTIGKSAVKGYLGLQFVYAWDVKSSRLCASMGQKYPEAAAIEMGCADFSVEDYMGHFILPNADPNGLKL